MVTTIKSIHRYALRIFFSGVEGAHKVYSLSKFQVYNTELSTIVTMTHIENYSRIRSLELRVESLDFLTDIFPLPPAPNVIPHRQPDRKAGFPENSEWIFSWKNLILHLHKGLPPIGLPFGKIKLKI